MHLVKDPVCGMELDEKTAPHKSIMGNNVYYFCSASCQTEFNRNLRKYAKKNNSEHHASHYGGYCGPMGCRKPARGIAWYFYIGLLALLLSALLLTVLFAR